jgi:hypothetical protein
MKKTLFAYMAILLAALGACYAPNKPGAGLYFFMRATSGDTLAHVPNLTVASFLELRPDGTYTQDFGQFNYGTWMLKDQRLYLTNQRHRTFIYLVVDSLKPRELDLSLDSGRTGYFHAHSTPSGNEEKDPFSTYNNQWRIPAKRKESDAEIRSRLKNHCQFWEAYFTWAKDKEEGAINVMDIPTPLKIYGNGFGLKHYSDLPGEWRSCFYDTVDCHKADTMIKHTFRRHDFVWPKTDDDLKKLISGTHQLQEWLK